MVFGESRVTGHIRAFGAPEELGAFHAKRYRCFLSKAQLSASGQGCVELRSQGYSA